MSDFNNFDPNAQQNSADNATDNAQQNYGGMSGSYTQPTGDYSQQSFGYTGAPMQQPEQKGKSIASLVLGLCGFIAWCLPLIGYPVTIVGIVLGVKGMKEGGRGMAIAGIVCSVITLIFTIINSAVGVLFNLSAMGL